MRYVQSFSGDIHCRPLESSSLSSVILACCDLSLVAASPLVTDAAFLHDASLGAFHTHSDFVVNMAGAFGTEFVGLRHLLPFLSNHVEELVPEVSRNEAAKAMLARQLTRSATSFPQMMVTAPWFSLNGRDSHGHGSGGLRLSSDVFDLDDFRVTVGFLRRFPDVKCDRFLKYLRVGGVHFDDKHF